MRLDMNYFILLSAGAILFAAGFFIGRSNQSGKREPADSSIIPPKNILEAETVGIPKNESKQWTNWLNYDGGRQDEEV
jgi:hypothetical protein